MKQQTLAMAAKYETGVEQHCRPTRHDELLDTMNRIVPWADLCAVIDPTTRSEAMATPRLELALAIIYLSRNRLMAQVCP